MRTTLTRLAAALGLLLALALPGASFAHVGDAGPNQTITQAVGPYELAVTITLPPAVPAPLAISIMARGGLDGARLWLRATPRGSALAEAPAVEIATVAETPLIYKAQLTLDRPGDWELEVRADGPRGAGAALIPFTITPVPLPPYTMQLLVSLGGLFVLMLAGVLVSAAAETRGRSASPRVSWAIGQLAFGFGIAVAIFGGLQIAESFRSAIPATAVTGRPSVNVALSLEPAEPTAGQTTTLTLDLSDGSTGLPVDDLTPHHEALLHLVLIDTSGTDFQHLHPARVDPGGFRIAFTPLVSGRYTAYAEVARHQSGTQVIARSFAVGGATVAQAPNAPGLGVREIDDLTVDVTAQGAIRAGRQAVLNIRIEADGKPLQDIEPWLGMAGHLIARSEDGAVFSHVHADAPAPPAGPLGSGMRYGPELRFVYTFPTAGRYQLWAQFQRAGRIITVPLVLEVPA